MPAKVKKTAEKEPEVAKTAEEVEEVIKVKTSKKPTEIKEEKKPEKPKITTEAEKPQKQEEELEKLEGEDEKEIPDTETATISSFSKLDSEVAPSEEQPEEEKLEEEKPEGEEKEEVKREVVSSEEAKKWIKETKPEIEGEEAPTKGLNLKTLAIILIIIGVVALVVGGIIYFRSSVSVTPTEEEGPVTETAENTPTPTLPPEEEEGAEINFSDYSISVLNGSGIPGEAGKVKDALEEVGFEEIETGNAESYDYEKTEISFKVELPENVYKAIEDALSGEYEITKGESSLPENSTYDVIIIVGTRK